MQELDEKQLSEELDEKQLLKEQLVCMNKQLKLTRVICLCIAAVAIATVIFAAAITPRLASVLNKADAIEDQLDSIDVEKIITDLDGFISEGRQTFYAIGVMAEDSLKGLGDAMKKIDDIDIEGLNKSIETLHQILEPLGRLFSVG